jgi:hypothetical protein
MGSRRSPIHRAIENLNLIYKLAIGMGPNHSPMEWGPKQINDPFRDIVLLSVVLLDQISALVPRGGSWHWPMGRFLVGDWMFYLLMEVLGHWAPNPGVKVYYWFQILIMRKVLRMQSLMRIIL